MKNGHKVLGCASRALQDAVLAIDSGSDAAKKHAIAHADKVIKDIAVLEAEDEPYKWVSNMFTVREIAALQLLEQRKTNELLTQLLTH